MRFHPDPRKQRKLIPSKISRYTVVELFAMLVCTIEVTLASNMLQLFYFWVLFASSLQDRVIGDAGAQSLAKALIHSTNLQTLK